MFPCDITEIKLFLQSTKKSFVIVKPEASCQGRGIFLTRKLDEINNNEKYVVQEYISQPLLIDNLKFDLRVYVLVTSCDPLRIFVYEDGLVRLATENYEKPSSKNIGCSYMHLTNYAINKTNPGFINNKDLMHDNVGHKRSLKSVFEDFEKKGHNVKLLKSQINDIIIKTLCAIQPNLSLFSLA